MTDYKRGFGSDNHASVHPSIMESLNQLSLDHAPSYGTDAVSLQAAKTIQNLFGSFEVFFVFNGTAANVLSLKSHLKPFHSVIASDVSHLNVDECGAPEHIAGVKILSTKSENGKLSIEEIDRHLIRLGDQHSSQVKMLSITQPTELGTIYTLEELLALREYCTSRNLIFHCDGTRFINACVALDTTPKAMAEFFDVISLGGTKNGLMMGEAVLIKDLSIAKDFKFYRKQALQLPSKTRYIAAQFERYFSDNLYLDIANHSCSMAKYLEEKLSTIPNISVIYPVESNAVFIKFPKQHLKALREHFFFYVWDEHDFSCRLMLSFDSTKSDIDQFAKLVKETLN